MTRSTPSSAPERLAALRGASPRPAGAGRGADLGPHGVWPPPRTSTGTAGQAHGDPPTVPLPVPVPPGSGAGARSAGGTGVLRRLVPAGWRGARVDPGRLGATALVIVAAVAAVVAAVGVWIERPRAEPIGALPAVSVTEPAAPPTAGAGAAPEESAAAATPEPADVPLVVSVSGKVAQPGLVEVPAGARVADVLEAAGGALPGTDLSRINLARRVADGEQVAVGVPPAPDAAPVGGSGGTGDAAADEPTSPIDLNAATADQLEALPGVGPVTAERILEWRARNGRFARVEQLREIDGIGERRFAQLRERVRV